jgi:hypothetical protein
MLRTLLQRLRRKRLLERCVEELGPLLIQRYGAEKHYSPGKIRATLDAAGLDRSLLMIACAMYASLPDFADWVRTSDEAMGRTWVAWSSRGARGRFADHAELYRLLRRKAAAANGSSYRFLPEKRADHDGVVPVRRGGFGWYD